MSKLTKEMQVMIEEQQHGISFFVCNKRGAIINRAFIQSTNKPFIIMENGLRMEVVRERWLDE